ncbi:MAG: hypothetical protein HYS32_00355 [Candidatus Woesearchaeota archaeon]|nr:MAG: hypothetical protein HYS32_00355 [Candidatus Woesearchaeota archaeon]
MKKEVILRLANEAFKEFPHKIDKPSFQVIHKNDFVKYVLVSPIIRHHKSDINYTPSCSVYRNDDSFEVYFCVEVLLQLLNKIEDHAGFVKALTLHELYHIWNRHFVNTEWEALESEAKVHYELGKDFPQYAKLLEI